MTTSLNDNIFGHEVGECLKRQKAHDEVGLYKNVRLIYEQLNLSHQNELF